LELVVKPLSLYLLISDFTPDKKKLNPRVLLLALEDPLVKQAINQNLNGQIN
jgi:hypothetical protein